MLDVTLGDEPSVDAYVWSVMYRERIFRRAEDALSPGAQVGNQPAAISAAARRTLPRRVAVSGAIITTLSRPSALRNCVNLLIPLSLSKGEGQREVYSLDPTALGVLAQNPCCTGA